MIIELKVTGWDKYNARSDVKSCTWFRMSNDFFADPDFYGTDISTRMVWIYILSMASKKNNATVRLNIQMLVDSLKIAPDVINFAISTLCEIGCIATGGGDVITARSNTIVTNLLPSATDRQTDRRTDNMQSPKTPVAVSYKPKNKPTLELANDRQASIHEKLSTSGHYIEPASLVIEYFNKVNGRSLKQVKSNYAEINARLKEGFTVDEMKELIDHAAAVWSKDSFWSRLNRPGTLFTRKFDQYLSEAREAAKPRLDPLDVLFGNVVFPEVFHDA